MTKDIRKTTMLNPSQVAYIIDKELPVLAHGRNMDAQVSIVQHAHPRGQLLWAEKGVLRVTGEEAVWVVPSTHAMWIPGGLSHQVSSETNTHIRNIYIDPSCVVREQETGMVMLTMSSLLKEIILRLTDNQRSMTHASYQRLGLAALDELQILNAEDIFLHAGSDPRLQRVINQIVQSPQQPSSLQELSAIAGASVRTIERLFKSEIGLTFRQWRSRFRLMNALTPIIEGDNSTQVAQELGYRSVSSFIKAFKEQFGCTPQEYKKRY